MPYLITKTTNGKFMFNLKATNHEVVLTSELYEQKANALAGVASVQKHCVDDANFELKRSSDNQPYFVLKASNAQVIGKSQMYSSEAAAKSGIESVKRNGVSTEVLDNTGV